MQIELKVAGDQDEWNRVLERCPQRTVFHTWKWLKVAEKHSRTKLYPLIGMAGTTPVGIYPLFFQRKSLANLVFSPPSGTGLLYLGPLIIDYDGLKQDKKESALVGLQKAVDGYIFKTLKANYARIRTSPDLIDARFLKWNGYLVEPFYTYVVDMKDGIEKVWSDYNSQVRKDIKKTEREGVTVEEGSKKDLDLICRSLAERFTDQGLEFNIKKEYLMDLYDDFYPENLRIFLTKHEGEYLGGQVTLFYNGKALLWVGVPKSEKKGIYPNDLLQWEMMKLSHEKGCRYYELMCAGDDPRLRHFKSKFNPGLSLWYSGERYSSCVYLALEKAYVSIRKVMKR